MEQAECTVARSPARVPRCPRRPLQPKQDRAGGWRSAACGEGRCALGELPKSSRPANQPGARLSRELLRKTIRARFSIDSYGVLAPRFKDLGCDGARVYCLAARLETGADRASGGIGRSPA